MGHTFVKEVMKKDVLTIDSQMTVKDAALLMGDTDVGCVIITKDNAPVGILTERDFVKRITAKELPLSTSLSEVMSSPLKVTTPNDTVWDAAEVMQGNNIHKLPVQEDGLIVGIITTTDLVKLCSLGSDSNMRNVVDQILLRMRPE